MVNLLLALSILGGVDLSDLPDGVFSAEEAQRAKMVIGRTGSQPVYGFPVWIEADFEGTSTAIKTRASDAFNCAGDETFAARWEKMLCKMREAGPVSGDWFKHATQDRYAVYVILRKEDALKLLGCIADGSCNPGNRVRVAAGTWDDVRVLPVCDDYFSVAQCSSSVPPAVFAGVDPNYTGSEE